MNASDTANPDPLTLQSGEKQRARVTFPPLDQPMPAKLHSSTLT